MVEVGPCFIECALLDFNAGFCRMQICHCLIQIGLRGSFSGKKVLCARCIHLRKLQPCLRTCHVAFRLSDSCLKQHGIDLSDDLAGFYLRIKIHKQFRDISRNLAADLDVDDRIECTRCRNRLGNGTACDRCGLIVCSAAVATLADNRCNN